MSEYFNWQESEEGEVLFVCIDCRIQFSNWFFSTHKHLQSKKIIKNFQFPIYIRRRDISILMEYWSIVIITFFSSSVIGGFRAPPHRVTYHSQIRYNRHGIFGHLATRARSSPVHEMRFIRRRINRFTVGGGVK